MANISIEKEEPWFLADLEPGVPFLLTGISWDEYLDFSERMSHRRLRTTYCDGEFEIFPASFEHELRLCILGSLFDAVSQIFRVKRLSIGSSTLRRDDLEIAMEPERSYYLRNSSIMLGKMEIDLPRDPPPDLAIEVDIPNRAAKRMRVLAGLGVPEVWRYDGQQLTVHLLQESSKYARAEQSHCCPVFPIKEVVRFVKMQDEMDDTSLVIAFREWLLQTTGKGDSAT